MTRLAFLLALILCACDMHAPSRFIRTADAELLDACDQAAERWYDATGIRFECVDMHFPNTVELRWGQPSDRCAAGMTDFEEIVIRPEAPPEGCNGYGLKWTERLVASIVVHEMGHILAGRRGDHAEDGVMARSHAPDAPINQATLDWLCATAECEWEEAE